MPKRKLNVPGKNNFSLLTAISVVIANMIGTGVFTSLGFQVMGITSGFALMMLWLLGGVVALCGAFAYSDLSVIIRAQAGNIILSRRYTIRDWVSWQDGSRSP